MKTHLRLSFSGHFAQSFLHATFCTLLLFMLAADCPSVRAQSPTVSLNRLTNQPGFEVRLNGRAARHHRFDFSTNLLVWSPFDLQLAATGTAQAADTNSPGASVRFYRAVEVDPRTTITRLTSGGGADGSRLTMEGHFFASQLGENLVTVGGIQARVVEASQVRLVVEIPPGSSGGAVRVVTPAGTAESDETFSVLATNRFVVAPPNGFAPSDFLVANSYGPGVFSPATGEWTALVRTDRPLLTSASPRDTNRACHLYAITVTNTASAVTIDAASTAQALVFLNPFLSTVNPHVAGPVLAVIRTNALVQAFAQHIALNQGLSTNPMASPAFIQAYADAVLSVGTNPAVQLMARTRQGHIALASHLPSSVFDADLSFLNVTGGGQTHQVTGVPLNPVDWLVLIQEIDADLAFPNGRRDFNQVYYSNQTLVDFPLVAGGFTEQRSVSADLLSARLNPVKYLTAKVFEALTGPAPDTLPFQLPDRDGVYLVRGIGPAFAPADERAFALARYNEPYKRALAANLVTASVDLIGGIADLKGIEIGIFRNLGLEALKKVPLIQNRDDALVAIVQLQGFLLEELASVLAEGALGSLAAADRVAAQAALRAPGALAANAVPIYKALDIASSIGQSVERLSGIFIRTTPLETALITVGDPFTLELVSVSPPGGGPADTVVFTLRKGALNPNDRRDRITFIGTNQQGYAEFDAEILSVTTTPGTPVQQSVTARLPGAMSSLADGTLGMHIFAQGRRLLTNFNFAARPFVASISPNEGFAASDTFGGTFVQVRGFGFSPDDTFLFGGVPATLKSGTEGLVTLTVPRNAVSGALTVRRNYGQATREDSSQAFSVIGPPTLTSLSPDHGPVGTWVTIEGLRLAAGSTVPTVRFSGAFAVPAQVLDRNRLMTQVPLGAQSGPVTVETPAGTAQLNFTVEPGRAFGGTIIVGGTSLVSLQRGVQFAARTNLLADLPADDEDSRVNPETMMLESLDPPFEEGDFVTDNGPNSTNRFPVGAAVADRIIIQGPVSGTATLSSDYDDISTSPGGVLAGTLIISGSFNTVSLTVSNSPGHGVIIRGHNNSVSVTCLNGAGDGVRIEGGSNNVIYVVAAGNAGNGVTVLGGATGNQITVTTEFLDPFTGQPLIGGNQAHGVALMDAAVGNTVSAIGAPNRGLNTGDGLRLDGPGVRANAIGGQWRMNRGNGITVTNGASSNVFTFVTVAQNGGNGLVVGGGPVMPRANRFEITAQSNTNYGAVFSGVSDPATTINLFTGTNRIAGTRLENGTAGLSGVIYAISEVVGIQLDGTNTTANTLIVTAQFCSGDGIVLNNAVRNELSVTAQSNGGTGLLLNGARENRLNSIFCQENAGDGVRFSGGAELHTVDGGFFTLNRNGIVLESGARNNVLRGFRSMLNLQNGVLIQGSTTTGNRILQARIGRDAFPVGGNGADGIRIRDGANGNAIGGTGTGCLVSDSAGAAVRITDAGTRENTILGCTLVIGYTNQPAGIIVENGATDITIGGPAPGDQNFISYNGDGIIVRSGASRVVIQNNFFQANTNRGLLIDNATFVRVGGDAFVPANVFQNERQALEIRGNAASFNGVSGNIFEFNTNAIRLAAGASRNFVGPGNRVQYSTSLAVSIDGAAQNTILRNVISFNYGAAVLLSGGAVSNRIVNNGALWENVDGVVVQGAGTVRNTIQGNSITGNTRKGIELSSGGNDGIAPPAILGFTSQSVYGTTTAPDGSRVEVFMDFSDEGETILGAGPVRQGRFRVPVDLHPAQVGQLFQVNATVTDPQGNTSEFGRLIVSPQALPAIAFTSTRGGNPEIFSLQPALRAPVQLTFHPSDDSSPAFSPDGRQLAFVSQRGGMPQIHFMTATGGGVTRLTTNANFELDPAWAPDGTNIVFTAIIGGNWDIYRKSTGATNITRITSDVAMDRSPTVSPDGTKIAFTSTRAGGFDLFVMNSDGSNPQPLVTGGGSNLQPAWSPDGQSIAFASDRDGNLEIYTVRADGTQLTRRTNHSATDTNPAWTPSGRLLYASNRDEGFELYQLDVVTGETSRLTVSSGDNTQPTASR